MKQPLKLRQVLFCALFSHGLYKTNIVQVLYVQKSPLCKRDTDTHPMYMQVHRDGISGTQVLAEEC